MNQTETERFVASSFRSVWDLEILLELRRTDGQHRNRDELITTLRASEVVVSNSIASLVAAGLVAEHGDERVSFAPASEDAASRVADAAELYRTKPDAVRRLIVASSMGGLTAFSNAFKIKGDR